MSSSSNPKRKRSSASESSSASENNSSIPTTPVRSEKNRKSAEKSNPKPAVSKVMLEWQQERNTVRQRDLYIHENELYTDCTFSMYGANKNEHVLVKCHRIYLAKSSSVFSTMFYGEMKKDVIHLPDVNLEAFRVMLMYIYEGEVDLECYNYKVVCDLLYIAKKYRLPELFLEQIYGHLWLFMYPDNVWSLINFAGTNNEPQLEETAWKVVEAKTTNVIQQYSFTLISTKNLLTLVQRNNLSCSETKLFIACLEWAESEAGRLKRKSNSTTLREILKPILPHIRFCAMKGYEFAENVVPTKILKTEEMCPILANLHVPYVKQQVPKSICTKTELRNKPQYDPIFVYGYPYHSCGVSTAFEGCIVPIDTTNTVFVNLEIMLEGNRQLEGLDIPMQLSNGNLEKTYEEHMTIMICDKYGLILFKEKIRSTVYYDSLLKFYLPPEDFHNTKLLIIFHKTGLYPTLESGEMLIFV